MALSGRQWCELFGNDRFWTLVPADITWGRGEKRHSGFEVCLIDFLCGMTAPSVVLRKFALLEVITELSNGPGVWSQVHDEGVQALENIANIRVPVIAAIEGRAHVHSDYALLASVIVAGEGATFQDVAHFGAGVAPGDGIFTTWSYRAGAGRAEAFLLNPQPLPARTAREWGVVAEVVPNGKALSRARELAELYLKAPEVTRRNTRIHFIQPLKERIVRDVGYGLSLEGASSADLVKSMRAKSEPVAQKGKVA